MATIYLVRHGQTTANASAVLAGWTPQTHLNDVGRAQVEALGQAFDGVKVDRLVASPLVRCQETAGPIAEATGVDVITEDGVGECHYGAWTGRKLAELAQEPLWTLVQTQPSAVTFPSCEEYAAESIAEMQVRAVSAVRRLDAELEAEFGSGGVGVVVSHGDVIKSIINDASGAHLDAFQRIACSPASVSVVRYTADRPYVVGLNVTAGGLGELLGAKAARHSAVVGGESGNPETDGAENASE